MPTMMDGVAVEQQCLRCPTCGQPMIKKSNRLCCICGKPISKGHKFFFNNECKVQHKNCDCPDSYKQI